MKTHTKIAATLATGLILCSAGSYAGALASSAVKVSNLTFSQTVNAVQTQLDRSDFGTLAYTSSADADAKLTGFADLSASGSSTNAAPLDLYSCLGDCAPANSGYTDNDFSALSSFGGLPTTTFSIADTDEFGSPITGLLDGDGNPVSSPADLGNASYVSLTSNSTGSSQTNNELSASFTLSGISGIMDIDFDITAYVEAYVQDHVAPTKASASFDISFNLVDLDAVFSQDTFNLILASEGLDAAITYSQTYDFAMNPFTFGISKSANSPLANNDPQYFGSALGVSLAFPHTSIQTFALDATHRYQLTATTKTAADAQVVPEPGVLALMGLGLVGIAGIRRKKA